MSGSADRAQTARIAGPPVTCGEDVADPPALGLGHEGARVRPAPVAELVPERHVRSPDASAAQRGSQSAVAPARSGAAAKVAAKPSLAILASVGEIDPLGTRKDGLDVFLDEKVEEGYTIESRTDTHAIIARRPKGLKRFTSGADPGRYVVEVDEDGVAKMRPAEPRRA